MITSWDIYWITRLDSINALCAVIAILGCIFLVLVVSFSFIIVEELLDSNWKAFWKKIIIALVIVFPFLLGSLLIPTSKEFAAIYLIPKIANNEQIQKIPDNAAKLLNTKLEQWLDDAVSKKKEEK